MRNKKKITRKPMIRGSIVRRKRPHISVNWFHVFMPLVVILLMIGAGYLWFSNILRVNYFEIQGNVRITSEQISAELSNITGSNIFLLSVYNVKSKLERKFPQLQNVTVKRQFFPNKITIEVSEKAPVLTWHTGDATYAIDRDGVVIGPLDETITRHVYAFGASPNLTPVTPPAPAAAPVPAVPAALAVPALGTTNAAAAPATPTAPVPAPINLRPGAHVTDSEMVDLIVAMFERLPDVLPNDPIQYVAMGEFGDLSVMLKSNLQIRFPGRMPESDSSTHTLDSDLKRLADILKEGQRQGHPLAQYVDLRFEKVYGK